MLFVQDKGEDNENNVALPDSLVNSRENFNCAPMELIDVTNYGALADGDVGSIATERNDAAVHHALRIAKEKTHGLRVAQIYFPPGNGDGFYALSGIRIEPDNQVILTGSPGILASRIKIVSAISTITGRKAGTYFANSMEPDLNHHSWSGIANLGIVGGTKMDSLVEIETAHNAMTFGGIHLKGERDEHGPLVDYGLRVGTTGLSRFRINNFYSTGFGKFNFGFPRVSGTAHIEVSSGNVDVAIEGFADIHQYKSGPTCVVLMNLRMECSASNTVNSGYLIQLSASSGANIRFYGCLVSGSRLNSLVYLRKGTPKSVRLFADVTFSDGLDYWLRNEDISNSDNVRSEGGNKDTPKRVNIVD